MPDDCDQFTVRLHYPNGIIMDDNYDQFVVRLHCDYIRITGAYRAKSGQKFIISFNVSKDIFEADDESFAAFMKCVKQDFNGRIKEAEEEDTKRIVAEEFQKGISDV